VSVATCNSDTVLLRSSLTSASPFAQGVRPDRCWHVLQRSSAGRAVRARLPPVGQRCRSRNHSPASRLGRQTWQSAGKKLGQMPRRTLAGAGQPRRLQTLRTRMQTPASSPRQASSRWQQRRQCLRQSQRQSRSLPPVPVQTRHHHWQQHSTPLLTRHSLLLYRRLLSSHLQQRQSQRQSRVWRLRLAEAAQQSQRQPRRCHPWTLHTKPDDAAVLAASCWRAE
jgi:hypothetical protein